MELLPGVSLLIPYPSGELVPDNACGDMEIERFCNGYQLQALKQIGAPQVEIDYMSGLDGKHCNVDHDGDYDWDDYQNRKWLIGELESWGFD